jgi:hypothetical protein
LRRRRMRGEKHRPRANRRGPYSRTSARNAHFR